MIKFAIAYCVAYSIGTFAYGTVVGVSDSDIAARIYFSSFSVILFAFLYSKVLRK